MEGLKGLEWSSQSLDLHLIEMGVFHNGKQTINSEKPANMAEVKQICKKRVGQNFSTAMTNSASA